MTEHPGHGGEDSHPFELAPAYTGLVSFSRECIIDSRNVIFPRNIILSI